MGTSILICIPSMIFGVSLAISYDEENIKWTKTTFAHTIARLVIGLSMVYFGELIWESYTQQYLLSHSSTYILGYLVPYAASSFFIYGLFPIFCE